MGIREGMGVTQSWPNKANSVVRSRVRSRENALELGRWQTDRQTFRALYDDDNGRCCSTAAEGLRRLPGLGATSQRLRRGRGQATSVGTYTRVFHLGIENMHCSGEGGVRRRSTGKDKKHRRQRNMRVRIINYSSIFMMSFTLLVAATERLEMQE